VAKTAISYQEIFSCQLLNRKRVNSPQNQPNLSGVHQSLKIKEKDFQCLIRSGSSFVTQNSLLKHPTAHTLSSQIYFSRRTRPAGRVTDASLISLKLPQQNFRPPSSSVWK